MLFICQKLYHNILLVRYLSVRRCWTNEKFILSIIIISIHIFVFNFLHHLVLLRSFVDIKWANSQDSPNMPRPAKQKFSLKWHPSQIWNEYWLKMFYHPTFKQMFVTFMMNTEHSRLLSFPNSNNKPQTNIVCSATKFFFQSVPTFFDKDFRCFVGCYWTIIIIIGRMENKEIRFHHQPDNETNSLINILDNLTFWMKKVNELCSDYRL